MLFKFISVMVEDQEAVVLPCDETAIIACLQCGRPTARGNSGI